MVFAPVVWGIRIEPTVALVRVVRGDESRDVNCPIPPAYCMTYVHALRPMSLDSWALGCPGYGNILFQRR